MSEQHRSDPGAEGAPDPPAPQRLLDNLWLLLAIGIVVPTLLYLAWGVWELIELPTWGGG